jgi:hypothetical protein
MNKLISLTEEQRDEVLYILTHLYQGYQPIVKAEMVTGAIDALQRDVKEELIEKIKEKADYERLDRLSMWEGLDTLEECIKAIREEI